jgi:acetolactate synthase I/II/III large subunit
MRATENTAIVAPPGAERVAPTAADAAIEALRREGVDHVFGLPGTTTMHLLDALARRRDIRYVSVRHEQVAGFMADGFARGSGRLGVCMASRGPGAANVTIALHNAHGESVPVLALIGQVDDEIVYREGFEEVDLVAMFEPLTKWSLEVHDARRVPELVQRAAGVAATGRPRPVMASIPLDVQKRSLPEPVFRPPVAVAHPVPPPAEVERAAELLAGARRPVILVGGGAERAGAAGAVARLAEALDAPVAASWHRKAAFPDGHRAFVGVLGFGALEVTERAVREADVVLSLGCRFSQFTSARWTLLPPGVELIQVDVDAEGLGRAYAPAVALHGDARATAEALIGERAAPAERLAELRRDYEQQSRLPAVPGAGPVPSAALVRALRAARERHDPIFVQDAPTFGVWMQRYLPVERPGSYYGNAGGAMGWGLPAALGIQLAQPGERVLAVVGDGSFWMVAQDLETAVRERIPVVTVVANNFAYGNTRDRQRADHGGRLFGVLYDNPDFAAFARLVGAHGERVERTEDLYPAIDRAIASGLPAVVDVIQDVDEGLPPDVLPPGAGEEEER